MFVVCLLVACSSLFDARCLFVGARYSVMVVFLLVLLVVRCVLFVGCCCWCFVLSFVAY